MNKLVPLLFICYLFSFVSCKKEEIGDTVVFGTVRDITTNELLEGVSIYKISYYSYMGHGDTVLVCKTDKDGKYLIKDKLAEPSTSSYYITYFAVRFKNYYDYVAALAIQKYGGVNECNIKIAKLAYLKVHAKNASPFNSSDLFWYSVNSNNPYENFPILYGTTIDTTIISPVIPNITHRFSYGWKKNGITSQTYEDVHFQSGDTVAYSILY